MSTSVRPIVLTIAGSDSSGGAGIQADQRAIERAGGRCASVITAVTAQGTRGVTAWEAVSPRMIEQQLAAIFESFDVAAVKTGMISTRGATSIVAAALRARGPLAYVCDPVLASSGGVALQDPEARAAMREELFPLASVVTPNALEAAALTGRKVTTPAQAIEAGRDLLAAHGPAAVLVKGGHLEGDRVIDSLVTAERVMTFEVPRVMTGRTHGTGCTHSALLATLLARGVALAEACRETQQLLAEAIGQGLHA